MRERLYLFLWGSFSSAIMVVSRSVHIGVYHLTWLVLSERERERERESSLFPLSLSNVTAERERVIYLNIIRAKELFPLSLNLSLKMIVKHSGSVGSVFRIEGLQVLA